MRLEHRQDLHRIENTLFRNKPTDQTDHEFVGVERLAP
jgi:hypothetical protein